LKIGRCQEIDLLFPMKLTKAGSPLIVTDTFDNAVGSVLPVTCHVVVMGERSAPLMVIQVRRHRGGEQTAGVQNSSGFGEARVVKCQEGQRSARRKARG